MTVTIAGREVELLAERQVESYVRISVEVPGGSVEAGLQRATGEPLHWKRKRMRELIEEAALVLNGDPLSEDNGHRVDACIEQAFCVEWPGLAWFTELWIAGEALTQVYAPWGMPRHNR